MCRKLTSLLQLRPTKSDCIHSQIDEEAPLTCLKTRPVHFPEPAADRWKGRSDGKDEQWSEPKHREEANEHYWSEDSCCIEGL